MKEEVQQLKQQVEELTRKVYELEHTTTAILPGNIGDLLVERVFDADLVTGTPPAPGVTGPYTDNTILYQLALPAPSGDVVLFNFPARVLIYKWKGQRLAIPVYDATTMIYP